MAVGIYKQGQGYWVRVLTAIFAGAVVLAAAAWAFAQAVRLPIPQPTSRMQLAAVDAIGEPAAGSFVELYSQLSGQREQIGTAVVQAYTPGESQTAELIVSDLTLTDKTRVVSEIRRIEVGGGIDGASELAAFVESTTGIDLFAREYLQAGLAGAILLIGAVLIYLFVGAKRQSVDFLIATDGEMKKVNWSTRREVQGSTIVVIVASMLLAVAIFFVDYGFGQFFKFIGVLE
ncbi:MAG: preprotein translocase subunit SecE [Planctomycetota bacterium]